MLQFFSQKLWTFSSLLKYITTWMDHIFGVALYDMIPLIM